MAQWFPYVAGAASCVFAAAVGVACSRTDVAARPSASSSSTSSTSSSTSTAAWNGSVAAPTTSAATSATASTSPTSAATPGALPAVVPPVPTLVIPRLRREESVLIDGKLDDDPWKRAAFAGPFVEVQSGASASADGLSASARLLWSESHLLVAFEVYDRDLRGGFAPAAVDAPLWLYDMVELLVDPDGDGDNKDYYELAVSPQNLVFDSHYDDYNAPLVLPNGPFGNQRWESKLESAVALDGTLTVGLPGTAPTGKPPDVDTGYVVELRVPWTSFTRAKRVPPQVADRWRANLWVAENNAGVAWSPVLHAGNVHRAARFGVLVFGP